MSTDNVTLEIELAHVNGFISLLDALSARGAYVLAEFKLIAELSEVLHAASKDSTSATLEKNHALTLYNIFVLAAARGKFTIIAEYENIMNLFNIVKPFAEKYGKLSNLPKSV
jgi:hypothetical protein